MMVQRVFIGYPISLDLRMRLNVSKTWRNSRLNIGMNQEDPIEAMHQNVVYLGYLMEEPFVPLKKIELTANRLSKALHEYCTDYSSDITHICCFPQTFVQ